MLYQYDASNESCPLPLVKLRVMLKKMSKQDTCLIIISDEGSKRDIPKLLTKQRYQFKQTPLENNRVEIFIEARN